MREWARRLLAYEAAAVGFLHADPPAAILVTEKLRRTLSTLAGAAGYHAFLRRALTLSKIQGPSLGAVQINSDGSLEGLSEFPGGEAAELGTLLIAQLLGLLVTFLGESATLRLVHDTWPDLPIVDTSSGEAQSS